MSERIDESARNRTIRDIADLDSDLSSGGGEGLARDPRMKKGDIIALVLSVLVALSLWFYVMAVDSPDAEQDFTGVSVELRGEYEMRAEKGWSLITTGSRTVDLMLRGKKSLLSGLSSEDILAFVDLSKIESAGRSELPIEYELPEGVTCLSEKSMAVEVDELLEQRVPVEPVLTSYSTGTDYAVGSLQCNTAEITVSGPARELARVASARAIVDMENRALTDSFTATVMPVLCDENGQPVVSDALSFNVDNVAVTVPVYLYKTVDLTLDYKYGYFTSDNIALTIDPASIRVYGAPATVSSLRSITLATLDETTVTDDMLSKYTIPLPAGVTAADGTQDATVTLHHVGTTVRTVTVQSSDIVIHGGEGLNYRIKEPSVDLRLRCDEDRAATLTAADLAVSIDLGTALDKTEGTIQKTLTVGIPGGASPEIYLLEPDACRVTVELLPPEPSSAAAQE